MNLWFKTFSVASTGLVSSLPVFSVIAQVIPPSPQPLVLASITHLLHFQINVFVLFPTMPSTALYRAAFLSFSFPSLKLSFAVMLPKSLATARSVVC